MKLFPDKKYNKIFMYCFSFTIITLLIITILFRWDVTRNIISNILNIFEPIILAAIIAFIMNPMMKSAQKFLSTKIFRKKPHPKLTRVLGIMFASIVIIAVIAAVILSVIPELISNIPGIYDGLVNDVIPQVQAWITKLLDDNPSIAAIVNNELESITSAIERLISGLVPQLTSLLASVLSFANSVKNFFFGFILAIYFLFSKEVLQAQAKKVIVALFSEKVYHRIFSITSNTNHTFLNFIYGQIIDAFIVGCLCAIFMLIFKMPYVMIISLIVGTTNIIPIFGPFIGAIPAAILILIAEPRKVIWFIIFIIALQQLDGNVISPKILGNKIGLPSFWVLFSILICSSMFGIAGMIIGVPLFAVLLDLFSAIINAKLKKKDMPTDREYYSIPGVNIGTVTPAEQTSAIEEITASDQGSEHAAQDLDSEHVADEPAERQKSEK